MRRVSLEKGQDNHPVWSPDDTQVYFSSMRGVRRGVHRQNADGSGKPEELYAVDGGSGLPLFGMLRDGSGILLGLGRALAVLPLSGPRTPRRFLDDPSSTGGAGLSPENDLLVYHSNESKEGMLHVYVRPFPDVNAGRVQVSLSGGGRDAMFSRDGTKVFYLSSDDKMMRASIATTPTLRVTATTELFDASGYFRRMTGRSYDVTKDGKFLMIKLLVPVASEPEPDVRVTLNWFDEVRTRLGR
jgi:Tol biopolymer transport system component